MLASLSVALALVASANARTGAFAPGMYCHDGTVRGEVNQNTKTVVNPLYKLAKHDWWFQHDCSCDAFPPPAGEFLQLPANGAFTAELAHNRAFTTLSYGGKLVTDRPGGGQHPAEWSGRTGEGEGCIQDDGALHVQNETSVTGTAFAIAYESNLSKIAMEDLVLFTVAEQYVFSPSIIYSEGMDILTQYDRHTLKTTCELPNTRSLQGFKCTVTSATATHTLAPAVPAVYCKDDPSKFAEGAKQMIVFNQAEGDNVPVPQGARSLGYNADVGFLPDAQKNIVRGGGAAVEPSKSVAPVEPSKSVAPVEPSKSIAPIAASSVVGQIQPNQPIPSSFSVRAAVSAAPSISTSAPVVIELPALQSQPLPTTASTTVVVGQPRPSRSVTSRVFGQPRPSAGPGKSCKG